MGAGMISFRRSYFCVKSIEMKKMFLYGFAIMISTAASSQVNLNQLKKKITGSGTDSVIGSVKNILDNKGSKSLSKEEVTEGLKQALTIGTKNSALKLSAVDGFFKDEAVKIIMPQEAQKVVKTLRDLGMGSMVDKAELSMNRAAEDAVKGSEEIFINAIRNITIADGIKILKGSNNAATEYLKESTNAELTKKVKPVVEASINKVSATKYWRDVFTTYNRLSKNKVNPDLSSYVVEKTLQGLYYSIAQEEQKIRKDPAARVTDLLKRVFE